MVCVCVCGCVMCVCVELHMFQGKDKRWQLMMAIKPQTLFGSDCNVPLV